MPYFCAFFWDSGLFPLFKIRAAFPVRINSVSYTHLDVYKRQVFSGDATDEALTYIAEEDSIYRGTVDLYPFKGGYECAYYLYQYITEGAPDSQNTVYLPYVKVPKQDVLDGTSEW